VTHNESIRKFERRMGTEADHAHDGAATELEAVVSLPPSVN
jgi:hypothetical protein